MSSKGVAIIGDNSDNRFTGYFYTAKQRYHPDQLSGKIKDILQTGVTSILEEYIELYESNLIIVSFDEIEKTQKKALRNLGKHLNQSKLTQRNQFMECVKDLLLDSNDDCHKLFEQEKDESKVYFDIVKKTSESDFCNIYIQKNNLGVTELTSFADSSLYQKN